MLISWRYPLVIEQFAIENGPCVDDLPMKHGDVPVRYVKLAEDIPDHR